MARFCTKCGKELSSDGVCSSCQHTSSGPKGNSLGNKLKIFISKVFFKMGLGETSEDNTVNSIDCRKIIVPDIISQNENEIPIKQYDLAKLRSRILGKYADAKLAVTNQRIILYAPGISYTGKILLLSEFSIDEIGGIEIKRGSRLSFLNILIGFLLSLTIASITEPIFTSLNKVSSLLSMVIGLTFMFLFVLPFFFVKKNFWVKLLFTSAAFGISDGITSLSEKAIDYLLGESFYSINDTIATIVGLIWIWNLILVCLVPDLRFSVKTKGGCEGIELRRKIWGIIKEPKEYSGFSEVIPMEDVYEISTELGTMIHDLQTMGDMAIEKWKEN